jgi:M6 family metalloprotease-like protein
LVIVIPLKRLEKSPEKRRSPVKNPASRLRFWTLALIAFPLILASFAAAVTTPLPQPRLQPQTQASTAVALSDARFQGLTRIVASTNVQLTGLTADQIAITRPDGALVPPSKITTVSVAPSSVSVSIDADQFGRITSEGTTIATKAFGTFKASPAAAVQRVGEPVSNGCIIGTAGGLDMGWNTIRTDLEYVDPETGEKGLYRQTDVTPNRDGKNNPVEWNGGRITTPLHRSKTMLMLLIEFPDRLAANAGAPYTETAPYLEFLRGCAEWFNRASYGQFRFSLASPQAEKNLGWIKMDKNATEYRTKIPAWAYIAEACQKAYDNWGIEADKYDLLVIMPAKGTSGLRNGPSYTHRKPTGDKEPHFNRVTFVDKSGKKHYIDTGITAGNDLWRWGYRWAVHETGHTMGLPDIYTYGPVINDVKVGTFFYCGGWEMMGNIAGHSTDHLAWYKWKLHWLRDDQVDVVSRAGSPPTTHYISPVETPGGTKMVVVRTGLDTAYVAEFRTKLGLNALDERGKYSGVLIYRIDAAVSGARGTNYTGQVISKKYYNHPFVGGPKNMTGLWRPFDNGVDGYDNGGCCWQPGDVFEDPATGVKIKVDGITNFNAANPDASPYTANDIATISVTKTRDAQLNRGVVLANAKLKGLTTLTFDTNIELQRRIRTEAGAATEGGTAAGGSTYIREDSMLWPKNLVITRADGSKVPADKIIKIKVYPVSVEVTLAAGAFANAEAAKGATVATKAYYHFAPGAPVPVQIVE